MADKRRYEGRHQPLAELATRQHGVVAARQLLELGYSRDQISGEAARGRLLRLHRGVYAVGHGDLTWPGRCLAVVLASAPALASHVSAGRLWGLLKYDPQTIDLMAGTGRRRNPSARMHRARLTPTDEAEAMGIPVTSVARTVLDLAATLPTERFERAFERAEELRIFDLREIDEVIGRAAHHPGVRPLKKVLALHHNHLPFTRSGLERRFLALTAAAGLPRPSMNFNVAGLELDAYWPEARFAVELDVYETHGGTLAFERDRLRDEELMLADVLVDRVTGARLDREPDRVIERIATLLQRRRPLVAKPKPAARAAR